MARLNKLMDHSHRARHLERRIEELEATAQITRLEAMRLAAVILTKMDYALGKVTVGIAYTEDLAALQVRHASLLSKAEDLQSKIDSFRADEYDLKHGAHD
jgi:hypothetical protein